MKKHFRILLGVGSAKKSSAPYVLQVLRAHGAEVANIPLACKSVSQKREQLTAITNSLNGHVHGGAPTVTRKEKTFPVLRQ